MDRRYAILSCGDLIEYRRTESPYLTHLKVHPYRRFVLRAREWTMRITVEDIEDTPDGVPATVRRSKAQSKMAPGRWSSFYNSAFGVGWPICGPLLCS